jgi:hypothetical protein
MAASLFPPSPVLPKHLEGPVTPRGMTCPASRVPLSTRARPAYGTDQGCTSAALDRFGSAGRCTRKDSRSAAPSDCGVCRRCPSAKAMPRPRRAGGPEATADFRRPPYLARKGAAALLGALLAALLFQRLLRGLLRELLRLLLTFHRPILRRRAGGQKKGRPAGRPLMRFPYVSAAQASGQAQSHIGPSRRFRPPPEGGYLQTTRSGAAARLRFCSPVREIRSNPLGPAAGRPFV